MIGTVSTKSIDTAMAVVTVSDNDIENFDEDTKKVWEEPRTRFWIEGREDCEEQVLVEVSANGCVRVESTIGGKDYVWTRKEVMK
jgi:hypothetical protein